MDPLHLLIYLGTVLAPSCGFSVDVEGPITFQEAARGFGQSVVQFGSARAGGPPRCCEHVPRIVSGCPGLQSSGVRPHGASGLRGEHVHQWLLLPPGPEPPAAPAHPGHPGRVPQTCPRHCAPHRRLGQHQTL
ncbi:uncharacterized protein LOC135983334 isoform X1 [Chrysemys picta bellii]|uniref:uncharacterized protein LOC135983334 isoform X1 n=1 Tax=Chrysemys picta bellii TaxID=8478 RepID=UPI0032B21BCB